jgi:putative DNA methylase
MTASASRKKLIEVSIPLEAINKASAREKTIRHGHPSTLHLWWARRPLAPCRAVLFVQLVDDPSAWPEKFPSDAGQEVERLRLHRVIEQMMEWPSDSKPGDRERFDRAIEAARWEIARSVAWGLGEERPRATERRSPLIFRRRRRPSTTRSAAAAQSRSKHSGWGCAPVTPI